MFTIVTSLGNLPSFSLKFFGGLRMAILNPFFIPSFLLKALLDYDPLTFFHFSSLCLGFQELISINPDYKKKLSSSSHSIHCAI